MFIHYIIKNVPVNRYICENDYSNYGKQIFTSWETNRKSRTAKGACRYLNTSSQLVSIAKGCQLYVVSYDKEDKASVYITEIWDSKTYHDNSLKVEGVRELIMKAMPILAEQPTKGQKLEILEGVGNKNDQRRSQFNMANCSIIRRFNL